VFLKWIGRRLRWLGRAESGTGGHAVPYREPFPIVGAAEQVVVIDDHLEQTFLARDLGVCVVALPPQGIAVYEQPANEAAALGVERGRNLWLVRMLGGCDVAAHT